MSSVFLIKALQLILSLAILVVLHELGHFIPAKLFKTKVEKFYLFFDWPFSLFKKKIGDTEYGIGVLPLGGYVKIAGMIDESMDTEHLNKEPEPWEFRSKPAWQRLIIMLGGIAVNIFLGFAIYAMVAFVWGKTVYTNENLPNGFEVAEAIKPYGFKDGDKILEVNGEAIENVLDINKFLFVRDVSEVSVEHLNGKKETVKGLAGLGDLYVSSGGGRNAKMGTYIGEGLTFSEAKKTKMEKVTVEGADLAKEIAKKVNQDFDKKKLPLMLGMINAIVDDKELDLDWEAFR